MRSALQAFFKQNRSNISLIISDILSFINLPYFIFNQLFSILKKLSFCGRHDENWTAFECKG